MREIAATAVDNLDVDPERSILLALEAAAQARSLDETVRLEAQDALHQAIGASRAMMSIPEAGGAVAWGSKGMFVTEAPDGSGNLAVHDAQTGATIRSFRAHIGDVTSLAISRDGTLLASTGEDGQLKVWDPATGELRSAIGGRGLATGVAFSSDGTRVAAAWPDDRAARIVDSRTGEMVARLDGPAESTALSPDGQRIAIVADGHGEVFEVGTGTAAYAPIEKTFGVSTITWSPDGRYLAVGGIAGLAVWDAAAGDHLYDLPAPGVGTTTWSADATRLASGGDSGPSISVWQIGGANTPPGLLATLSSLETSTGVRGLALAPNGSALMAGADDRPATKVWDLGPSGAAEVAALPSVREYGDIAFMPDGERLLGVGADGRLRTWTLATGQGAAPIGPVFEEHAFAVSPDGRWITGIGPMAGGWSTTTGELAFSTAIPFDFDGANWSPDSELLAIVNYDPRRATIVVDRTGRTVSVLPDRDGYRTWPPDQRRRGTGGDCRNVDRVIRGCATHRRFIGGSTEHLGLASAGGD